MAPGEDSFKAFFLPAAKGRRFCLLRRPGAGAGLRGGLVYVHPFAEEMNKARRMAALQARAFAAAGWAVLQIDLFGCGDSSGDFGEAAWEDWIGDALMARDWLHAEIGAAPWFWGLRAGGLVAAEAARRGEAAGLLFWQPVLSGRAHLRQFLRLKSAGEMLSGAGAGGVERLRAALERGEAVEVAGYTLSPGVALGLEGADLSLPGRPARVEWIETAGADGGVSPGAAARIEQWRAQGHAVRPAAVPAPAFWQTTEIAESQEWIDATLAAMEGWRINHGEHGAHGEKT
ncbi:MAG: hydrolase 2, exosortase A system-associated [Candidatus Accumulibacter sp.]|jgi:exosortase A-associated hydrolase 2|nr:hydrolase 2, exosortase A system-associated [Accumulibacter sp.]